MAEQFFILPSDRAWLENRIRKLEQEIKDLGPEFHEVLNQSSETWHDNAPFDAVREKQDLLVAERQQYRGLLLQASLEQPQTESDRVGVGSCVTLESRGVERRVFIAGHWSHDAGKTKDGVLIISCQAPIAKALLGMKVGTATKFGTITTTTSNKNKHREQHEVST